jgi:hypothetical protein
MSPQQTGAVSELNPIKVLVLAAAMLLALFAVTRVALSVAQDSQEPSQWRVKKVGPKRMDIKAKEPQSWDSQRIVEDQIPPRLPIRVELNNLTTESLLRDVEVKVTNEAKKPIYFLELRIVLPDVLSPAGGTLGFPLRYGRAELIKFDTSLQPGDVPLQPGETFVLKVAKKNLDPFDRRAAKGLGVSQRELRRAYLMFRQINFGDKTGFAGDGSPIPYTRKESS